MFNSSFHEVFTLLLEPVFLPELKGRHLGMSINCFSFVFRFDNPKNMLDNLRPQLPSPKFLQNSHPFHLNFLIDLSESACRSWFPIKQKHKVQTLIFVFLFQVFRYILPIDKNFKPNFHVLIEFPLFLHFLYQYSFLLLFHLIFISLINLYKEIQKWLNFISKMTI